MKIKKQIKLSFHNSSEMSELYRSLKIDYPKFFKMDGLSKLGFLASEMILKEEKERFVPREDVAMVCFNRSSSLDMDTKFQATICDNENYFPSPALFVYTLPNIVNGEIAIRNKFHGESFFYLCEHFDAKQIVEIVKHIFQDKYAKNVLLAWIESVEAFHEVLMIWVENEKGELDFTEEQIKKLYCS
jgi:3-oxoacyl-[acyl-carrier-protein] synthase-1